MVLVDRAWKMDVEYMTTPRLSQARRRAVHLGSQGSQGGILRLISSVLQERLLRVRIPFQTPLDIWYVYQFSWNTQKHFEEVSARKVDALRK